MTVPKNYLRYPHRHLGMDHHRYDWSILPQRTGVAWPNRARLALVVVPALEWFPLDMDTKPSLVPGALDRPYPDYWNYTLRDYGNRVGFFRVAKVLASLGVKASVAMNSALAERHPFLSEHVNTLDWEIIAHGVDMAHPHYGDMDAKQEIEQIDTCLSTLRALTGQPIEGWLSPGKSQSMHTLDLLAARGIHYVCDWVNDDMPYEMTTNAGSVYSLPHPYEIDDYVLIGGLQHSEDQFLEQIKDQFDTLYRESDAHNGRLLSLSLHPWVIGQPFRIKTLEQALSYILGHEDVWSASAGEVLLAFRESQASSAMNTSAETLKR